MGPFKSNWLNQSGVSVLALAVVFSVGVPYAVLQTASDGSINATQWVAHTEAVKSTLFEVMYRLRDLESSALNAYLHTGDEVRWRTIGSRAVKSSRCWISLPPSPSTTRRSKSG